MSTPRALLMVLSLACGLGSVLAQARRTGPMHLSSHQVRDERVLVTAGVGVVPTFLRGGEQNGPTVQLTAQYYLSERVAVGMAYGRAVTTTDPYVDGLGVLTRQRSETDHLGVRVNGSIVRSGPFELYGGLQLGMNFVASTQLHEFPEGGAIADEEAYLTWRTDPFAAVPRQISAIGFFGASVQVVPHTHVYVEAGNNLSLLTAGVELRL